VRVTHTDGFDGLPVFSPDGRQLVWTTNRRGASQLFMAGWDHEAALEALAEAPLRASNDI
jgi:Tol biopolymer transport system component